jgi:hypothetical protein
LGEEWRLDGKNLGELIAPVQPLEDFGHLFVEAGVGEAIVGSGDLGGFAQKRQRLAFASRTEPVPGNATEVEGSSLRGGSCKGVMRLERLRKPSGKATESLS